jgi:hypothetical protein
MKPNRLIGTIALSFTSFSLLASTASPARSLPVARSLYDCSSAVSLIMTPDGRCHDLTYLTFRGQASASLSAATQAAVNAFDNLSRDDISYTQSVGDIFTSTTISDNPTEDEMAIRRQNLLDKSENLRDASATSQMIETLTFPVHTQTMHELSGTLTNREASLEQEFGSLVPL